MFERTPRLIAGSLWIRTPSLRIVSEIKVAAGLIIDRNSGRLAVRMGTRASYLRLPIPNRSDGNR